MALTAADRRPNLIPIETWRSKRRDALLDDGPEDVEVADDPELEIAQYCARLYEEGVKARKVYETFDTAWSLFIGDMFPANTPRWKATIVINKIAAYILFMQAVMTDNKPRITVEPLSPGTEDTASLIRKVVDGVWDEENVQDAIAKAVLYGLIWGTGFVKTVYNPAASNGRGAYEISPIVPYRVYTNATATSIEDAEFVIHVEQRTLGWIRRNFKAKASVVARMCGKRYKQGEGEPSRDFIREGFGEGPAQIYSAQNVNGTLVPPQIGTSTKHDDDADTVEVVEYWFRDDAQESFEEQAIKNGVPQMRDVLDDNKLPVLEVVGYDMVPSPVDGMPFRLPRVKTKQEPVMRTQTRAKYPNGRLCVMAGPVVMRDIPNPFQTDGFPFAMWKDIDVDAFWGMGEAIRLKDCNIGLNRLVSQLYEIIEKTGNPSWKVKKGSGFDPRSMKNRSGQIIPLEEVEHMKPLEAPPFPGQAFELAGLLKQGMGEVSGLQDTVMGQTPGANTAFATVDQLQESGAAPLRQKVRNSERMITRVGQNLVALIQQFDNGDKPIRERKEPPVVVHHDDETGEDAAVVQPLSEADVTFRTYKRMDVQGPVEFGIVAVSSLSTSPAGKWARYESLYKLHLIDAQWFHETFKLDGWKAGLARMQAAQAQQAQAKAVSKKPGPAPANNRRAPQKPQPPLKQSVTREQVSAVR